MSEAEERSESPSPNRLRLAREEGDAATSATLTIAATFSTTLILLWLLGDTVMARLTMLLSRPLSSEAINHKNTSIWQTVEPMMWDALVIISPFIIGLLVSSTVSGLIQTRGIFSLKRVRFDPSHMSPGSALEQRFSTMQMFEFLKTLIKFFLVSATLYVVARDSIRDLAAGMANPSLWNGMAVVATNIVLMAAIAAMVYLIMGVIDFGHQYFEFIKRNQMTKSEVKQEMRDLYGDPFINGHLREQRESMIMGAPSPTGARPSVIVMNPTHFAVALFYEPDVVELPIVIAKGQDTQALQMRTLALELGVPVAERPPLARRLYRTLAVGQAIGKDDLESVAEVFRWLKQTEHTTRPQ